MQKNYFIIFALTLCFPVSIFAETIVLKTGKTVEGKIIERTDELIKVELFGMPMTYFLDDIERIDNRRIRKPWKDEEPDGPSQPRAFYDSQLLEYGIRFVVPDVWYASKQQRAGSAITYDSGDEAAIITIGFPKEIPQDDYLNLVQEFRARVQPIDEDKATFSGLECCVFTFLGEEGAKQTKNKYYWFYKYGKLFTIHFRCIQSRFNEYFPVFEESLESYEIDFAVASEQ